MWTSKGWTTVSAVFGEGGKNWRMLQGKANHRACLPKVVLIFLLVGRCGISSVCVIGRRIRCPKSQVVTQKLHDQRRVLVAILIKGVQLGNGLIKGLKSKKKKCQNLLSMCILKIGQVVIWQVLLTILYLRGH